MRGLDQPDGALRDGVARGGQEPRRARRSVRPVDRPRAWPTAAARHRARHGFEREPDPRRTGEAAPRTAISPAPAITRCSCSTSSAIWNAVRCAPATSTAPTAGTTCSSRSWPATGARSHASISAPTRPSPTPRSTSFWRPRGSSTRSGCRPTGSCRSRIGYLLKRPVGRPPTRCAPILRQLQLSGRKLDEAAPRRGQGRVASGRTLSARRLHRHQPERARPSGSSPSTTSAGRASNGSRRARTRSSGRGCHAARSPPTRCVFSFMRWPTISATSCGRWRCRRRSRSGR